MTTFIALLCLLLFAVALARFEKFTFGDCQLHIGPPDFWVFKLAYHIPMLVMFAVLALGYDLLIWISTGQFFGVILFMPAALWIEDMAYYVKNPFDKPDTSESITDAFGFIGKVPVVWMVGFLYTLFISWWRIF